MKHAGSICRYVGIKEIIQVFYTVCFIAEWIYSSIQAYQFNCVFGLVKLLVPSVLEVVAYHTDKCSVWSSTAGLSESVL